MEPSASVSAAVPWSAGTSAAGSPAARGPAARRCAPGTPWRRRGPRRCGAVLVEEALELRRVVGLDPARGDEAGGSKRTGRSYSVRIRSASTSNCSAPTTPTIQSEPTCGLKTCAAPSSANCSSALPRCLARIGSSGRTRLQKLGREARDAGEVQLLALGERVADAELAVVRDADDVAGPGLLGELAVVGQEQHRVVDADCLPVRTWCSFMPRLKWPEQRRTNAMRSRCFGSMFAWILKTKPVTLSSVGATSRRPAAGAAAAQSARPSSSSARRSC